MDVIGCYWILLLLRFDFLREIARTCMHLACIALYSTTPQTSCRYCPRARPPAPTHIFVFIIIIMHAWLVGGWVGGWVGWW